jgi:Head domain of trimeric autotransporter adhesin
MRKLFFLFTFCAGIFTAQAQTFTSGLTTTGTGATANTRLGGTSPLLVNTTIDLGTFTFGLKTTALPSLFNVLNNGNIGIGVPTPLSLLHIKAGTATAAPLMFTSGPNLATPAAGAIEFDGANLIFTPTLVLGRKTLAYTDFSNVTTAIPIAKGGTGASTLATGYVKSNGTVLSTVASVPGAEVSGNITGSAANVTGIVGVANGGTGAATNTGVLIGNGTAATTAASTTTALQYLRRNAANTGYEFATITGGTGTVTSIGLTVPAGLSVTPATAITTSGTFAITTALNGLLRGNGTGFTTGQANLATEVTGVLPIANGGTGATTNTGVLIGNGTASTTSVATTTASLYLRRNAANNGYEFGALPAGTGGTLGGEVTGAQTATVVGNAAVISKVLTGYTSTAGTVAATDNILQAIGKLNGNDALKVVANAGITAATNTKITYDSKGLVIAGTSLASADIPNNAANTTGNAATATTATNIAGGVAGNIPYQTGAGATAMIPVGTSGYVLTSSGAGAPSWTAIPTATTTAWGLLGNAGTTTANFVGTTDAKPLYIRVNNDTVAKFGTLYNVSMGQGTIASGNFSIAMGKWTTASGIYSTAIGKNSTASGGNSTAMGGSTASGLVSIAMGESTIASGYASTAMGNYTIASGLASTTMGTSTKAKSDNSLVIGLNNDTTTTTGRLFEIGNGTNAVRSNAVTVLTNGNVGIGTITPTAKLEVKDGNILTNQNIYASSATSRVLIGDMTGLNTGTHALAVNGTVLFTKATVRLTGTWPDYVFEPTNKLPTLSQVEAYITKHKHLEGVPSAAEVKEKGIDLGDNQTILLKKVEELTLYMIELNKKVEVLAKENEELKKKVNGDK